ncbi:helix-turn-helix domain-containing protein [Halalkalibacter nanhaiisediminis]|uniref:Cytoskeletal protein RodZ n=1 Tax=Halalkalibacter nanhaiisediminis TaxID=688079 RepID=A0A562QGR0_9BACI|nr:RodZ domain-containing protein [Halalkalibacter nanhaiisediminis]TWI55226.1 cytoskeletal protein RodZ [Halalkalibacter nanhaiisediminis]
MSELGQYLKEVREQKQISLDDLQRTTKIQKRYLIAIEEGRLDTLPGLFYARAFVKTYAEAIGLDPEPLFDQYRNELPNPQREAVTLPSRSERSKTAEAPKKRTKGNSVVSTLIAIVFIAVVVFAIWLIAQSRGGSDDQAVSPDTTESVEEAEFSEDAGISPEEEEARDQIEEPAPEAEPQPEVEPEPETEVTFTFVESSGNTSYFQLENGQLDDVRIELTGSSYLDVKNASGRTFYSGQPIAGEEIVLEDLVAEEHVIFNFGASQNVNLFIAGEQVEFPLDEVHQKIDITVTSDTASE